jgi:uncharacterized membrane protein
MQSRRKEEKALARKAVAREAKRAELNEFAKVSGDLLGHCRQCHAANASIAYGNTTPLCYDCCLNLVLSEND